MTSKFLKNHGDWFVPLTIWVVGVILLSASMVLIENVSIQDSVWYTVITSSTVGYGGIIASEPVTRILTIIFIFTSIGSLTAFIGAFVIRSRKFTEKKRKGLMTSKRDPDVIIAGYPTEAKVKELVRGLKHLWKGVSITCVTNQIEEKPGWMVDEDVEFIQGRASERSVMERANLHLAEKVMILANDPTCPDSDEYTSSIVMLCEILNPNAHTIAEKVRDNDDLFKLAKCDKVVDVCRPSELVHELLHEGAIEFIDTIFSPDTPEMQKNMTLDNEHSVQWYKLAGNFVILGVIPLGFSIDGGKTFKFAPHPDEAIPPKAVVKVITRD